MQVVKDLENNIELEKRKTATYGKDLRRNERDCASLDITINHGRQNQRKIEVYIYKTLESVPSLY